MSSNAKRLKLATLTPILPDELIEEIPLIEVYVATIKNPQTTSAVVLAMNQLFPIPELTHLKRIKDGKILLFPRDFIELRDVVEILQKRNFDISLIEENIQIVSVARIPPKIRRQYEVVHKLWPCNFHANSYLEKLCTNNIFSDEELQKHIYFMETTLEVCRIRNIKNATIVVDPSKQSIVGIGFSQIEESPIKHSVMMAIDEVARVQNSGAWLKHDLYDDTIQKLQNKFKDLILGFSKSDDGPYLCTGYYIYTINEPCITCAMALVHSRAKRVFYGLRSNQGGLGSLCKIHCVGNLNHHYEVFEGLLEEGCRFLIGDTGDF